MPSRRPTYHLSADSEAVLRTYYGIPEDRLRCSVTYEKLLHAYRASILAIRLA